MSNDEPVVLELAPLPREQIGPFFLLGVDKDADREEIEARWAERVIRARKNQLPVPLQDIHWARETLNDLDRRARADVVSLNVDTQAGTVRQLIERHGAQGPSWLPLDFETALVDYTPAADIPSPGTLRERIDVPLPPREFPAVAAILAHFVHQPLDPWAVELP